MAFTFASNKPSRIAEICSSHDPEQIIIWTQFDEEGEILQALIPDSVHLTGKTKQATRLKILEEFRNGEIQILIVKPRLMGTGLNLQHCRICIFSWAADSFEALYQAIGRIHRYGQKDQVLVYIPHTELEKPMLSNVMRKQTDYIEDADFQERLYVECLLEDLQAWANRTVEVETTPEIKLPDIATEDYTLIHDDCIRAMSIMPEDQFDLAVFSPPFANLYSYSSKDEDLGNCADIDDEFEMHFSFFAHHLLRVMKPGCIVALHVAPLAILKSIMGYTGIRDFPAECREVFESVGFIYEGKYTIPKNPQAQSIRTHAQGLAFKTLHSNSRKLRPAIPDYLLKFVKPGDAVPFANSDVTNEDWIRMANADWPWVRETVTLNAQTKRLSEGDIKHICPLQTDVIDAAIRLWSDRGEHVFSPFAGIGSEGVISIRLGRKFTGIELKREYFGLMKKNLLEEIGNIDWIGKTKEEISFI
jgi:DNA modification methylase